MTPMMQMAPITECSMDECAYNEKHDCHAYAITVHSGDNACSTFLPLSSSGGLDMIVAKVGACQRAECKHNADLVCSADGVRIGAGSGTARCLTFAMN